MLSEEIVNNSIISNISIVKQLHFNEKVKKINYVKSYGLACFCKIKDVVKVLLIKKKSTYEYSYFCTNNYVFNKNNLIKLFNRMTVDEKRLILTFNFDLMWNKLWFNSNSLNRLEYNKNKRIFEKNILPNRNIILNQLKISENVKNRETELWSIPKGRKNNLNENKILTAIREFNEETIINKNNYYLDFGFEYSYIIDYKYKIKYYIGIYKNNKKALYDITNETLTNETNGCFWFSLEEIYKECNYLYKHIKPAFNYIKNNDLML